MTILVHPTADPLAPADMEGWRSVPVAVAVDLMGGVGHVDPSIRPLSPPGAQPRLFGRAVTVGCEPPDFGAVVRVLDIIGPGDVVMIAAAGNREFAMIGEILGGHLRRRGGAGLVCDGAIRDVATLAGWPDFSVYTRSVTPRGPLSAERGVVNAPVVIGRQIVRPGDLVIGDDDGLVVLSPDTVRTRLKDALDRLALEARWIESLAGGRTAQETFGAPSAERQP
ncbi:MAG: dimethylmenaquinone methyltransferase [Bauldia sp.]|nr:dimethylmenaquinone methyltransferase [Bauldia sp.]